ncbi:phosphatidylinositol glycan class T [Cryptococcus deuterogattii R265]|uniref:phosphatidylinositol glycan class T n=1 Tax=Cryptococcus deuterogattii (strain R265) TaxID=294750 RepID=UPI0019378702|nr:phosphatidylinositol glycan class T [Cryptococcus deuterogattii R265]
MLLSSLKLLLFTPVLLAAGHSPNSFHESLTLHPLPDGKLSVLFEFTTYFTQTKSTSSIPQYHHSVTPPSLLLPLQTCNISEISISFVSGRWDQRRTSQSGPLHYLSGGGGGEVRGWVRNGNEGGSEEERWGAVTHALGGLFCAGLGPKDTGENVKTFGGIYPPHRGDPDGLTHFLLSHPHHNLCTENLTPFLSLLPSKGLSGLSALLAQPGIIFSWGFQSEGIEVIMPSDGHPEGKWTGWWEGVVDLIPPRADIKDAKRETGLESLFKRRLPPPCPEAENSVIRLILPENEKVNVEPQGRVMGEWRDGKWRHVMEWNAKDSEMVGKDLKFWWDEERFEYPHTIDPPTISVTKTIIDSQASDGTFQIKISNHENIMREAIYSEIWPWWVKGWMSEMAVWIEDEGPRSDLLKSISYNPSNPPDIPPTTIHLSIQLPPRSTLVLTIPFTKLTLKYTDHRPDAERGQEIPAGVLTLLDLIGEHGGPEPETKSESSPSSWASPQTNVFRSNRARIYTPRILLDIPTPDFSMPYNVIIMSSTVMAVFFGLMHGGLTRRWGWVEVPEEPEEPREEVRVREEKD